MINISSISELLRRNEMSDYSINQIISGPTTLRTEGDTEGKPYSANSVILPGRAKWRQEITAGVSLDSNNQVIRANFFKLEPRNIPSKIFKYHVYIKKMLRDTKEIIGM